MYFSFVVKLGLKINMLLLVLKRQYSTSETTIHTVLV